MSHDSSIEAILPEMIALRRDLHRHPELGYAEHRTAGLVAARLEQEGGFSIRRGVGGTGVVAVLGGDLPGPAVALRADMDALPMQDRSGKPWTSTVDGRAHTCGHDGHTAMLLGAAIVLARRRDELRGPVVFLFQPAEEGGAGGRALVEAGALDDPKVAAVFGMHGFPDQRMHVGQFGICRGPAMAGGAIFTITVKGRGGHAAIPNLAVDPVHAAAHVIVAAQSIPSRWNDPLAPLVVSVTRLDAGSAFNIIPAEARLQGTIRSLRPEHLAAACEAFRRVVEGTAAAHGCEAVVDITPTYPPLVNERRAHAFFVDVAREVLGPSNVDPDYPPVMGSEDFAFYAQRAPAAFGFLGLRPPDQPEMPGCHHPAFDFTDDAARHGIALHVAIALRFAEAWSSGPVS